MRKRLAVVGGLVALFVLAVPALAFAAVDSDVTGTLTTATTSLKDTLVAVAVIGLGVGVVLFAIRKGWRLIKGMTH